MYDPLHPTPAGARVPQRTYTWRWLTGGELQHENAQRISRCERHGAGDAAAAGVVERVTELAALGPTRMSEVGA